MVRLATAKDAAQIAEIYNHYILNTIITFEETPLTSNEILQRINLENTKLPWLVVEKENQILGYAYAGEWKKRTAYKHTVEATVYLKHGEEGNGYGIDLYSDLITQLKKLDYHLIIGGIALPNDSSIALHEKMGFQKVAHFKEVGFKFDQWIDVAYWELVIS